MAYAEKHAEEIRLYEEAKRYLTEHLNGHGKIPTKTWQTEYDSLLAERYAHVQEFYKLKDDVRSFEVLRRVLCGRLRRNGHPRPHGGGM